MSVDYVVYYLRKVVAANAQTQMAPPHEIYAYIGVQVHVPPAVSVLLLGLRERDEKRACTFSFERFCIDCCIDE